MIAELLVVSSNKGLHDLNEFLDSIALSWDFTKKQLFEINLILEELCTNYIEHVGEDNKSFLEIKLSSDGSDLSITVKDNGPPFNPTKVSVPDVNQPLDQRKAGGIGLHLVRHYTDKISYSRKNGKNIIYMKKKLE